MKKRPKYFSKNKATNNPIRKSIQSLQNAVRQKNMVIGAVEGLVNLDQALQGILSRTPEVCLQYPLLNTTENDFKSHAGLEETGEIKKDSPFLLKVPTMEKQEQITKDHYLRNTHPVYDFLWCYRQLDLEDMIYYFGVNTLPPYCHLLLKAAPSIDLVKALNQAFVSLDGSYVYKLDNTLRRKISELIINIYHEVSCCWFKAVKKAYYRPQYDNLKSYRTYLTALFKKYSRLLVVRVDLGYFSSLHISYETFIKDVDGFLKKISYHSVFDHKVGYIWKLEYGVKKGFHVHLLVFYNGAKRQADYYIAKQIGELWQIIDPLHRLYFNCHCPTYKKNYVINCLGKVERHTDEIVIQHLHNKVIPYFTKADAYITLFNQNKHKLSDRGQLPKS